MTEQEFLEILKETGGYITESHIVATSGKHLDAYSKKPMSVETTAVRQLAK